MMKSTQVKIIKTAILGIYIRQTCKFMKSFKFLTTCHLIKYHLLLLLLLLLLLPLCSDTAPLIIKHISLYILNICPHLSDDPLLQLPFPLDLSRQLPRFFSQPLDLRVLSLVHGCRLPVHHLAPQLLLHVQVFVDNHALKVPQLLILRCS